MAWFDGIASAGAKAWGGISGKSMVSGAATTAGIGAIGGGIAGGFSDNGSFMGGAFKGALAGAAVPGALKYGGMGLERLGASGVKSFRDIGVKRMDHGTAFKPWARSMPGMMNASNDMAIFGNKMSGVGSNFNGALKSGYGRAKTFMGKNGGKIWGGAKSGMLHGAAYAGGGAAAGAGGWLAADFANYGAGWKGVKPTSFGDAVKNGAMIGLAGGFGLKALRGTATGLNAAAESKFMSNNMKRFQGGVGAMGGLTKKVSENKAIKLALAAAAASSGVSMTKPVNR